MSVNNRLKIINERKEKVKAINLRLSERVKKIKYDFSEPLYKFNDAVVGHRVKYMNASNEIKIKMVYQNKYKTKRLKDVQRKTTVPLNWPYFRYLIGKGKGKHIPLILHHGIHYIYGLPGAGKTSLAYELIEQLYQLFGYGSYINAPFELPKYDELKDINYLHHILFEVNDHFGKVEYFDKKTNEKKFKITQKKPFDKRFSNLVFDELLSWLNHRQNNTGEYMEVFIALITFLAQRRHRHVKRAYFLNQLDTTDVQLMSAFTYTHEVQVVLHVPYKEWIKTGKLTKHIKGWYVKTFKFNSIGKRNSENKKLVQKYFIKKTANFDFYESLAHQHDHIGMEQSDYVQGYMGA